MDADDRVQRGQNWDDPQLEDQDLDEEEQDGGDGGQKERCPICDRLNEPGAEDVCAHWVGLLWEGEVTWIQDFSAIEDAWSSAEEIVQSLESRGAIEDFRTVCADDDVLDALTEGEPLWWTGEAEQVPVHTDNGMLSGVGASLYHEAPNDWLASIAARLRTVADEAERFEAERLPGDLNHLPRRVQRDVDELAMACNSGEKRPEVFSRLTAWIEEHCSDEMSDAAEGSRVALRPDALAGELENIDDGEVRDHLELDDDAEVTDEDRLTWSEEVRLPDLFEDADVSSGLTTIHLTASDGHSVVLVHDTRGYSFSGVSIDWYGAFPDIQAFEQALAEEGWIEGVDDFSELDTQVKLRLLKG